MRNLLLSWGLGVGEGLEDLVRKASRLRLKFEVPDAFDGLASL